MVPLLFITLIKAPISILAGHKKYQRPALFSLMTVFIIGCVLFTYVDEYPLKQDGSEEKRKIMTWIGLLAFCFIDVANEMISVISFFIYGQIKFFVYVSFVLPYLGCTKSSY